MHYFFYHSVRELALNVSRAMLSAPTREDCRERYEWHNLIRVYDTMGGRILKRNPLSLDLLCFNYSPVLEMAKKLGKLEGFRS